MSDSTAPIAQAATGEIRQCVDEAIMLSAHACMMVEESVAQIVSTARQQAADRERVSGELGDDSEIVRALAQQTGSMSGFLSDVAERLVKQRGVANQVTDRLRQIAEAGHRIEEIAQESRIVNINARIEAARLGELGKPFAVIAEQMSNLADDVDSANALVADLAEALTELMPQLVESTNELVEASDGYAADFSSGLEDLRGAQARAHEETRDELDLERARTQQILDGSEQVLRELSFCDPMSQSLRRIPVLAQEVAKAAAANDGSNESAAGG